MTEPTKEEIEELYPATDVLNSELRVNGPIEVEQYRPSQLREGIKKLVDYLREKIDRRESTIRAQGEEIAGVKKSWRCFHCDEVFTVEQEAKDHFAIEGIPPMCVDPLTKDEKARMVVVRKLESELAKWRNENEQLDHEAGAYHAMQAELGRYFGTCAGFPVKTAHQAFLVHEAVIGAKEAAEAKVAALENELAMEKRSLERAQACDQEHLKWAEKREAENAALSKDLERAREAAINEAKELCLKMARETKCDGQQRSYEAAADAMDSLLPAPEAPSESAGGKANG